ncbi:MAG: hypothetical protein AAGG50_03295 [Bacteroidota bacterium]
MSLDASPVDALQADLSATVRELEQGLAQVPLAKAVRRLGDWERHLRTSERDDLVAIADGLADLDRHLTSVPLDGIAIGETLAQLGLQTTGVADSAPEAMRAPLHRLGSLLQRAGYALAGNTRPTRSA